MGIKFILFIAAFFAAFWIIRFLIRSGAEDARKPQNPESMCRCAHCGLHVPLAETIIEDGHTYCSRKHQLAGPG